MHLLFILAFISLLLWNNIAKHTARFVSIKTFIWVIDCDSLLFKNVIMCLYVIHSQSLTLTSDDLIWSSCGNYYDHTSIVMKIIQKAAELWTAITGHESQHRQVGNTWTWSQVTTHCDLSALNIMVGSKQHLKNDQQIILLLLYCDSFMTFYQKYIFLELASYFLAKMIF